ncbi:MAG TPA: tetratricopeptide repeat protein [Gemmatimonadaceae bacterium]|nr:tetratricopeptide repeat protein [Gemmatimonadaceae bacterium]
MVDYDGSMPTPVASHAPLRYHPMSLRGLRDLYLRPTRYWTGADLNKRAASAVATVLLGIALAIDRIDTQLAKADVGVSGSDVGLARGVAASWGAYWSLVLIVGALGSGLVWLIGGWWYNTRLRWSGAVGFDEREGRQVYVFASLVHALPTVLYSLLAMVLYSSYLAAWEADSIWVAVFALFPFWAVVASYKGVRARFQPRVTRARVWFLVLPSLFYALVLGGFVVLGLRGDTKLDELAALVETDPSAAISGLRDYLRSRPDDDLAWTIRGHAHREIGERQDAVDAYQRALEINPRRVEALTGLGIVSREEGRYDESLAYYDSALGIDPTDAQTHSSVAVIALKRGDDADALSHALKAYALDSTDAVIAANLAVAYHYNGMPEMRDSLTNVARRLGYDRVEALHEIYRGERTLREQ